jgi:hypothetical protein
MSRSRANEWKEEVRNFLRLLTAGPAFFFSAWLLMVFAGIVSPDVGIKPFGYLTAMIVTVGLWLVQASAVGAIAERRRKVKTRAT